MRTTTKKTSLNALTYITGQILTIVLGILIPRLFILSFGSEVNGFISSINQLFVYVGLLEAGVATASLQALYYPTSQSDRHSINRILSATHIFYNRMGLVYVAVICVLAFAYPLLIESSMNYWVMVTIIFITGIGGAFPYFSSAKYCVLLRADGREYIITLMFQIKSVVLSLSKVVLLLMGANVIAVESVYLILGLLYCIAILIYVKKKYPWIDLKAPPNNEVISQRKNVFTHQISALIFKNTDILLLTFFCDLKVVSIYTLYKYLFSFVTNIINILVNSIGYRLGQLYHDKEKFLRIHNVIEVIHLTFTFGLSAIALIFIEPFLVLYTEGMEFNYILPYFAELMWMCEILDCGRFLSSSVITYAGHFKQTQGRSIVESVLNLGSSIILVNVLGIYGVVLGTVIALTYRTNDMILYANRKLLERSPWVTYRIWLVNLLFAGGIYMLGRVLPLASPNYFFLILKAGVMIIILIPLMLGVNFLINRNVFKDALEFIRSRRK